MALYGCETTPMPAVGIRNLAAAVVDVFMPKHTTRRSQELFWVAMAGRVRSPLAYAHSRRLAALRVAYEATPAVYCAVAQSMRAYAKAGLEGTYPGLLFDWERLEWTGDLPIPPAPGLVQGPAMLC